MTLEEFNKAECQADEIVKRLKNDESINNEVLVIKKDLEVYFHPKGNMTHNTIYRPKDGRIGFLLEGYNNWMIHNKIIGDDCLNRTAIYGDSNDWFENPTYSTGN